MRTAQRGRDTRSGPPPGVDEIKISSNENPLGPGKAVLNSMLGKFAEANRYPFKGPPHDSTLSHTLAALYKTKPDNIGLGAGSQEILKSAMRAFTSPFR